MNSSRTPRYLTTPDTFVGGYGLNWRAGVLSEHAETFAKVGGTILDSSTGTGAQWAVLPDGTSYPVLCSEIIEVVTEDGPISGRCGLTSVLLGCCTGHADEALAFFAMTEADMAAWERDLNAHSY